MVFDIPFFNHIKQIELLHNTEVSLFGGEYQLGYYSDNLYSQLGVLLPDILKNAANKRKAEYLAGRYLAKKALEQKSTTTHVPIDIDRSPIWPKEIVGSITHTDKYAYAAVARKSIASYIGIDIEALLSNETIKEVSDTIATADEQKQLQRYNKDEQQFLFTLLFSAKESLFKALYPQVKNYFDFLDAELLISPNLLTQNTFSIRLKKTLNSTFVEGLTFQGTLYKVEDNILTIISD